MRWAIGCMLTLLSGLSMGLYRAATLRARVTALGDFLTTIELLRTEISYAARPLGDCLCSASSSQFCRAAAALPCVRENPQQALLHAAEICFANAEDRKLAEEFSLALGSSDRDSQLCTLDFFTARTRHRLQEAELARTRQSKLSVYLGLCGALAVCIFFG